MGPSVQMKSLLAVIKNGIDEKFRNTSFQTSFAGAIFVDVVHGRLIKKLTHFSNGRMDAIHESIYERGSMVFGSKAIELDPLHD
jgi:hypothetical protein